MWLVKNCATGVQTQITKPRAVKNISAPRMPSTPLEVAFSAVQDYQPPKQWTGIAERSIREEQDSYAALINWNVLRLRVPSGVRAIRLLPCSTPRALFLH